MQSNSRIHLHGAKPHQQLNRSSLSALTAQRIKGPPKNVFRVVAVDISLSNIQQGPKLGSGNFGDVFEGSLKNGKNTERVVLKGKKNRGPAGLAKADKYFNIEASICRRLKGCKGVPTFLGVAGADVYLVWKYEGSATLENVLRSRNPLGDLADALGVRGDKEAVKTLAKRMMTSIDAIHKAGCVHRDVKPDNILLANGGKAGIFGNRPANVIMVDLGGVADLRKGTNYNEEESILDPVYGPPERYISSGLMGGIFGGIAWKTKQPDLFDAYSVGLVILQCAVPFLRSRGALQKLRGSLKSKGGDLQAWRESLGDRQQLEFKILDADGGKGWSLVKSLVRPRKGFEGYEGPERMSVRTALGHPFVR
mmetsp:Transcript_46868/g.89487  ORF Transcript_46868/g.89487 Transcript_46868/m.89487 type:complete len:366 (+) Transcript_46868:84-1181(+)|eukprot:CAMPEP_0114244416 /NCGR_PEP_ID=MMETSP0058-20121206/11322_1 /TAXON_ID=36894 /ORGANISM="Pyramimonas parkeae, CCMP726" /LENGTH=365 /DNA_ID=CAMNT_0001357343 /DNA_START=82 /DNA_END=1179 /DNA_ORIENTATION=-